jgi:hypothetical protein
MKRVRLFVAVAVAWGTGSVAAQDAKLVFLSCIDTKGHPFAVAFSEEPPGVWFRDEQVAAADFQILPSRIQFRYRSERDTFTTNIDRLSGRFYGGNAQFPTLISGSCEVVTKRRF